jgi:uncharacterized protein (DUF952 family)
MRTPWSIGPACDRPLTRYARKRCGALIDIANGFIHLSTAGQVVETAARHFAGQSDLLLVAIDAEKLGPALKYEPSRGGALFPHLYSALDLSAVIWVKPLPLGANDHKFPALEPS